MAKKDILQDGGDIQDTKDTSTIKWDGGDIDSETSLDDVIVWDGGGIEGPADTPSGDETTNGGEI